MAEVVPFSFRVSAFEISFMKSSCNATPYPNEMLQKAAAMESKCESQDMQCAKPVCFNAGIFANNSEAYVDTHTVGMRGKKMGEIARRKRRKNKAK